MPPIHEPTADIQAEPRCIACGGALAPAHLTDVWDVRFGVPGAWDIRRCASCGLEQISPVPAPDALGAAYRDYYNFGGSGGRYAGWRQKFIDSPVYRVWLALDGDISFHSMRGTGRLLDIGCNEGRGLALYKKGGFDAEGLETNPVAAAAARAAGHVVHEVPIERFRPDRPYDVAILSNVLEHALDPAAMLADIRRILKPGGQLWISCPNGASWWRHLFGRAWINWHVPFHIVQFTETTLAATLSRAGFTIQRQREETPALWVAQSAIARLFARRGRPTRALRNPVLVLAAMALARGALFPLIWLANRTGGGDCLIVEVRRD
jgi:SAM-dependent methyltransferase